MPRRSVSIFRAAIRCVTAALPSSSTSSVGLVALLIAASRLGPTVARAQIGAKTAANGTFVLDHMEDYNLTASGVLRAWIPDFVTGVPEPLRATGLSTSGLTLATGQSPIATLAFTGASEYGCISKGFGVPMPGLPGASTATHPGEITSFRYLTFDSCLSPSRPGQYFQVMLETYPGQTSGTTTIYPYIFWNYAPSSGTTFQKVTIDLQAPDLVQNAGSLTLHDIESQTRFLYFYTFAGPIIPPATLHDCIDDIRLLAAATVNDARRWRFHR